MLIASDATAKLLYTNEANKLPYAPKSFIGTPLEWLNVSQWSTSNFTGIELEGAKYADNFPGQPQGFYDMFAFVAAVTYAGDTMLKGRSVHKWSFASKFPQPVALLLYTSKERGLPVRLDENVTVAGTAYEVVYEFETFVPDAGVPSAWATFNETDFTHPRPCPLPAGATRPPPPRRQEVYLFHPRHEFNISQQDNGDLDGDVFFVCQDFLANVSEAQPGEDYQWISRWALELVPRWGQYQNCNGYPDPRCLGAERFWVGHEAALGMGAPDGGQCAENKLTGEWFSLPEGGRCRRGASPGDGTCTWSAARVKTIDGQCLLGHGFLDACRAGDRRAPFTAARDVFVRAFATDDPASGGCKGLPGP